MHISLFGIGYVGTVTAACLARDGHTVTAVDINLDKVAALTAALCPIVEPKLDALIGDAVAKGRLRGGLSVKDAVADSELSIVCVGTPSAPGGGLDTTAVERVAAAIGEALREKTGFHVVAIRSTLSPGAMAAKIAPAVEAASGRKAGVGFGLAYYPEFLREGSAIDDYDDPSLVVMATTDAQTASQLQALQPASATPPLMVSFGEAEAIKTVSNVWRATKVSFANEIGGVLGALDIDSHRVMAAVCQDRQLNVSPAYLKPGFAFGGSCLPKDLRAFRALGEAVGRQTPLLDATLHVNSHAIEQASALVEAVGRRRVAIIGLAFKPGTDDLRESPYLLLAERLAAKGYDLRVYDPCVSLARLTGANLAYAKARLPQITALVCASIQVAVRHAETLVLAHGPSGAEALDLASDGHRIVDLVRVRPDLHTAGNYVGLSW